jgi:uncharacterized protein YndB with AHSA1/START domain
MPSTEIVIDRPLDDVWGYVTTSGNWKKWWGGALQGVEPSWQAGARLIWESGPGSKLSSLVPGERLTLTSPFIESTFRLVVRGDNATGVSISFAPRGGAQFSDGGSAHLKTVQGQLSKLKQCIESEI